jgi:hypothetical protein
MGFSLDPSQAINILGYQVWDEGVESVALNADNPSLTRILVLNWTDIPGFLASCGGGYDQKLQGYTAPLAHPTYPSLLAKYATYLGIPIGGMTNDSNNLAAYMYGRVKLTFGRWPFLNWTVIPQADIQIAYRAEIDFPKSVSGGVLQNLWKFTTDNSLVDSSILVPVNLQAATYRVVRYNCSTNAGALQLAIGGTVNAAPFLGCAAQTLYFNSPTSSKRITIGGSDNWTNTFTLAYKAVGFNTLFNPNATGATMASRYQPIVLVSDGTTTKHPLGDFTLLAGVV